MKVHVMKTNAFVIENFETNEVVLQSYNSIVAIVDRESGITTLGRHWDYSVTTLKHVYQFLEEYQPNLPYSILNSRTKKRSVENLIKDGFVFYDPELI